MKKLAFKLFLTIALASGFFIAGTAEAYWCRFVPGYWAYGYWHPAHRVCGGWGPYYRYYGPYYGPRCRWVYGHYGWGGWIPGHRVCW